MGRSPAPACVYGTGRECLFNALEHFCADFGGNRVITVLGHDFLAVFGYDELDEFPGQGVQGFSRFLVDVNQQVTGERVCSVDAVIIGRLYRRLSAFSARERVLRRR